MNRIHMDRQRRGGMRRVRPIATAAVAAALFVSGSITSALADHSQALDPKVKVDGVDPNARVSDIKYATYDVGFSFGGAPHQLTYRLAYLENRGTATILECDVTCDLNVELSSWNIPERVKDHLTMSSIAPIVGLRRTFVVGEEYESEFRESNESRPLFRFTCTGRQSIVGFDGFSLSVVDALRNRQEMDLVLSPDFPFPLYIRENVGSDPIRISLRNTNAFEGAAVTE